MIRVRSGILAAMIILIKLTAHTLCIYLNQLGKKEACLQILKQCSRVEANPVILVVTNFRRQYDHESE